MPHVEVVPVDELPAGVPADARVDSPADRGERGRFSRGNTLSREGGKSRAGKTRLASSRLGLSTVVANPAFAPYRASAESFRRAQTTRLASTVGGGECGPAPSSIVASAALQLAASRFAFDHGEPELGSKLANDSRQNLLAAHELCAREAVAKRDATPARLPWLVDDVDAETKP
jgi:hypothetical protein